eukprot:11623093-Alexandrium_andersonii.AAC.1
MPSTTTDCCKVSGEASAVAAVAAKEPSGEAAVAGARAAKQPAARCGAAQPNAEQRVAEHRVQRMGEQP